MAASPLVSSAVSWLALAGLELANELMKTSNCVGKMTFERLVPRKAIDAALVLQGLQCLSKLASF